MSNPHAHRDFSMTKFSKLASTLLRIYANRLRHKHQKAQCVIGFDGFTDEIISVVDTRIHSLSYSSMKTMEDFGKRILSAAGKSCNIELVVKERRLGGNAPLLTNALLEGGHDLTFIGPIGNPKQIEPLFQQMAKRCRQVFPLGPSALTHALEFQNGKILLGKMNHVMEIGMDTVLKSIPQKKLVALLDQSDLFVCANWTMLPKMTNFWKRMLTEIVPYFTHQKQRILFVDLADPAKRTDKQIKEALVTLKKLRASYSVILGLNEAEAERIASVLSLKVKGHQSKMERLAKDIQLKTHFDQVVIHPTTFAVVADKQQVTSIQGPYCANPVITTGGGDNFNAGYLTGLLYGLSLEESLACGVATSGFYVRYGHSPSLHELSRFLINGFN